MHEVFYIHSIIFAASRANDAFDAARYLYDHNAADSDIFSVMQEALMHVAALSRYFWPVRGSLAGRRGEKLRMAFCLTEDSVLKQRELRNAIEHYDEYLDRFLLSGPAGECFPNPIVTDDGIFPGEAQHAFKLLDVENCKCVILGKVYDFSGVPQAVRRVLKIAIQMDADGGRLRFAS